MNLKIYAKSNDLVKMYRVSCCPLNTLTLRNAKPLNSPQKFQRFFSSG